ncbi:MAG: hypothetical protein LBS46_00605 [Dysgonamonadaceae bacterium]|jgi:hypothetical protein|nr:hypothetical protein [Dysgonamonadaceae bacterium]
MEQDKIKQLLERYWQCETSIEDEQMLGDFFASDSVPEKLKMYKTLFVWKDRQKVIQGAPVHPVVSKRPVMHYFYPALKIAASVLVVLTFGISVYTHYQQEKFMDEMFSESTSDALDMRRDSIDVMARASLQMLPEEDSLRLKDRQLSQPELRKE